MIVNSKESAKACYCQILEDFEKHKFINVKISKQTRTLKQNSWTFKAYDMLSKQGDLTAGEYRNFCKYHYGLSIRAASEPEFAELLKPMLKSLDYEQKVKSMMFIDVTSTFDTEQMGQYINEIIFAFIDKLLPSKNWGE